MITELKPDVRLKQYVDVVALHTRSGQTVPQKIILPDGRTFEIDKVWNAKRLASTKVGGIGICYCVSICGRQTRIFDEENGQWFVEARPERT